MGCLSSIMCSWPKWHDSRQYQDNGKVKSGSVVNTVTQESYGVLKDSDSEMRLKVRTILFFTAPAGLILSGLSVLPVSAGIAVSILAVLRVASRLTDILCGDFITSASQKAKEEWLVRRLQWRNNLSTQSKPTRCTYGIILSKHILLELTKNILKAVTIPLQTVALFFAGLYSQFDPVTGRWMLSGIEDFWSRDIIIDYTESSASKCVQCLNLFKVLKYFLSEMIAPCMQPRSVWDNRNLYVLLTPDVTAESIRGQFRTLIAKIQRNRPFWDEVLKNPKFVNELIDVRTSYKDLRADWVRKTVSQDLYESTLVRESSPQGKAIDEIRGKLNEMGILLDNIEFPYREMHVAFDASTTENTQSKFYKLLAEVRTELAAL